MTEDLPLDPNLDDLPPEVGEDEGPLNIRARDPETGETVEAPTTREDVASGLADLRRSGEMTHRRIHRVCQPRRVAWSADDERDVR